MTTFQSLHRMSSSSVCLLRADTLRSTLNLSSSGTSCTIYLFRRWRDELGDCCRFCCCCFLLLEFLLPLLDLLRRIFFSCEVLIFLNRVGCIARGEMLRFEALGLLFWCGKRGDGGSGFSIVRMAWAEGELTICGLARPPLPPLSHAFLS